MGITTLLLLSCCWQDPQPGAPPALDVVELRNGEQLVGRIRTEIDGYVEIELEAGATVGIASSRVKAVHRGAGPIAPAVPAIGARDAWFVLHDSDGQAVGWLHASCTVDADQRVRVHEEYEFAIGVRQYAVTSFAVGAADLTPHSCYFRERVREPVLLQVPDAPAAQRDRIVTERIVEATVEGGTLKLLRRTDDGAGERTLVWPAGGTFPLLAREQVRRGGAGGAREMFDPATEELVTWTFEAGRARQVVLDGKPLALTELAEQGAAGRSAEWVDASLRTVRRELAGPSLVAVPSDADSALRLARSGHRIEPARVTESAGAFALWVPNPSWQVQPSMAGQIALRSGVHDGLISVTALDHLGAGASLDTAAGAVARWLPLVHVGMTPPTRSRGTVRDKTTEQLVALVGTGSEQLRIEIDVVPAGERFLVLTCQCRQSGSQELAADFAFVRRSLELTAPSTPNAQPASISPSKAVASPVPADKRELPHVRVPRDPARD
ncbi:MAG: hypothetical protein IPK26_12180 [Planctomycetes bacterium]|nr:hypothetical protein [Planctomycetota bacterium]